MKYRKIGLWVTAVILLAVIAVCIFMAVRKNAADEPEGADADTPSEELKEGLKAVYSAVLIICGTDNGEPLSCYTVNGAYMSILSLNEDNRLGWKLERFMSASYAAPATDAYCMKAVCNDYLYTFDEDGTLLDSKQDGYSLFFR